MITNIISAVSGLLGAIIGGFFVMWAANRSHKLRQTAKTDYEKEMAHRVRALLSVEIDDNLRAFEKFDAGINENTLIMGGSIRREERPEELTRTPLTEPKHSYWDAMTESIPKALTAEEIRKCHEFHWHMQELTRLKGLSHVSHGTWHNLMEQSIRRIKEIKNPLLHGQS